VTPDDYMAPRPNKPISRARLALEAAHWATIVFVFMLAVLSLAWAMEITAQTPLQPPLSSLASVGYEDAD